MKPKYKQVTRNIPLGAGTNSMTSGAGNTTNAAIYTASFIDYVPIGWFRWKLWLARCPLWSKP
jgi:hypothetical protein